MSQQNNQLSLIHIEDEICFVEEVNIKYYIEQELQKMRGPDDKVVPVELKKFVSSEISLQKFMEEFVYDTQVKDGYIQQFTKQNITKVRKVRLDGNCFYTALGFMILDLYKDMMKKYKIHPITVEQNKQKYQLFHDEQDRYLLKQYLITLIQDNVRSGVQDDAEDMFRIDRQDYFYEAYMIFIRSLFYNFMRISEYKNDFIHHDYLMFLGIRDPY